MQSEGLMTMLRFHEWQWLPTLGLKLSCVFVDVLMVSRCFQNLLRILIYCNFIPPGQGSRQLLKNPGFEYGAVVIKAGLSNSLPR